MNNYRIVTNNFVYRVQRRFLYFFWVFESQLEGYNTPIEFNNKLDALNYIYEQETLNCKEYRAAVRRENTWKPIK